MKKFLSLVLALVMTMSLVTVGAGAADFTDEDSITYEEAVEVMTALGVVGGYSDGSFGPKGTLTRGAAAKIICNLILGTTTANALAADSAPYSDVPVTNTFAGYIAYLAKAGVIGGYADGTFRPSATLTGYAFMKMLLGVIGLDASIEGYTGANWSIAVAKRALSEGVDLTDGLVGEFNGTKAVTREEACLYAFNAIKAGKFTYENKSTLVVGDITVSSTSEAKQTGPVYYKSVFSKLAYSDDDATMTDAFGRPSHKWTYDGDKIGTYNDSPVATFEGKTSEKDVYVALDGDDGVVTIEEVYEDGDEKDVGNGISYYKNTTNNAPFFGYGIKVEIYEIKDYNDEGVKTGEHYRLVAIRDYIGKVTGINKADEDTDTDRSVVITLESVPSGFESKKVCEAYETEDFAKKDMVIVNVAKKDNTIVVKSAKLAEKLEDKTVASYKTGTVNSAYVTVDGEKYNYSQTFTTDGSVGTSYDLTSGNTYDFWLDSYGNVIKTDAYETSNTDYVRVIETSNLNEAKTDDFGKNPYFIYKVVKMDGTVETIKVQQKNANGASVNSIRTLTEDEDKDGYMKISAALPAYDSTKSDVAGYVNESVTSFSTKVAKYGEMVVNNDTVFVLKTDDDTFKVVTGLKKMSSYDLNQTVSAVMEDGVAVVVYADITNADSTSDDDDLVYIVSTGKSVSYDATNKYYVNTYKAIVDGKLDEISVKQSTDAISAEGLYIINSYVDGYVKSASKVTDSAPYAVKDLNGDVTFKSGVLTLDNGDAYVIDDDAVVYHINSKDELTVTDAEALDAKLVGNVYIVMESTTDKTVNAIYFDGTID